MRIRIAVTALWLGALPLAAQQQTAEGYRWAGKIPAGRWIMIRDLNGGITVGAATGDNVEVVATKRWQRGDPAAVHFDMKKSGAGNEDVLICALWGDRATCDDQSDSRVRNNDVSVDFRVLVPRGVKVSVKTVNGGVRVDGATAEVAASTVNGEINVATSGGPVNATTTNGAVRAQLGRVAPDANMRFATVNGSVAVEFNGDFGADVDLHTVNGSLNTNFPMTVSGRLDPKHLQAHIGAPGGPRIELKTVNGSVELKKR